MNVRGPAQNARVFNRDGWKCVYCGYNGDGREGSLFLEMDHLDPTTKIQDKDGGDYDPEYDENKVTCCIYCNKLKGGYQPNGKNKEEKLKDAIAYIQPRRERALELYTQRKQAT
jgi:5-methylcytosine-specific restriction endonuclease McrA